MFSQNIFMVGRINGAQAQRPFLHLSTKSQVKMLLCSIIIYISSISYKSQLSQPNSSNMLCSYNMYVRYYIAIKIYYAMMQTEVQTFYADQTNTK